MVDIKLKRISRRLKATNKMVGRAIREDIKLEKALKMTTLENKKLKSKLKRMKRRKK